MRVIGGEFRSRAIKSLPGLDVRPTPDRLREALFNILAPRIEGAVFADLYAGSGAVGIEALSRIRSDPRTRFVPVYMLTTTDNPAEVSRCFRAGCNAYLTKPISYEEFTAAIERLCAFLNVTQIPPVSALAQNASA